MTPLYEIHLRAAAESFRSGDLLWSLWRLGLAYAAVPDDQLAGSGWAHGLGFVLGCRDVVEAEWDRIRRRAKSADFHASLLGGARVGLGAAEGERVPCDTPASPSRPPGAP